MERHSDHPEQSGSKVGKGNKLQRRSYDANFKIMVINAAESSNNCQAAKKYHVTECNVRRWRAQKDRLRNTDSQRKAYRGPKCGRFEDIDKRVCDYVTEKRNKGMAITRSLIQRKALELAKELNVVTDFKASIGWCKRMMQRNGISLSPEDPLPSDLKEKLLSFQRYVITFRKSHSCPLDQIANADQTQMGVDMPTYPHKKGEKLASGTEKSRITVMLACLADGSKLPPYVVLKRKKVPKGALPAGIIVRAQDKDWVDTELFVDWLRFVWGRRRRELTKKGNMLVFNTFRGHFTDRVKTLVRAMNVDLVIIPGGMTSQPKVLDVVVNKPFKDNLRKSYTEWLLSGNRALTPSGKMQKPAVKLQLEWILQAWDAISTESIINGFERCCISNELDGSGDDVMWKGAVEPKRKSARTSVQNK